MKKTERLRTSYVYTADDTALVPAIGYADVPYRFCFVRAGISGVHR